MSATNPKPNDLHIDVSDIKIKDLHPDDIKRLSKVRPGSEVAIECLLRLSPELIERAGISPAVIQKAADYLATDSRCGDVLPAVEKLVDLLRETRLDARHQLAIIITDVSRQARYRADRDPLGSEILAALEELLDYHYGPAEKGTAKKEKEKKAAQAAETAADPPAQQPAAQPPAAQPPAAQPPAAQPAQQP